MALTARSSDELAAVAGEIEQGGGETLSISDDLSDRAAPARILQSVRQHWGAVEILVNNAGVGSSQDPKPIVDFDDDFWDLTFAVNVTAPYLFTKLALPDMQAAGWGRIVNIASINAKTPAPHAVAYVASKHAVAGLTKSTALEMAGQGITVNAVCPGVTKTRMNDKRIEYDAERLMTSLADIESKASPLGRRLLPNEVASLVAYLAREEAGAINGQLINVCGGRLLS